MQQEQQMPVHQQQMMQHMQHTQHMQQQEMLAPNMMMPPQTQPTQLRTEYKTVERFCSSFIPLAYYVTFLTRPLPLTSF